MVEAGPRRGPAGHVPLADEGGLVAGRLQQLREGRQRVIRIPLLVGRHPVHVGVDAGEVAGARRAAERRGDEGAGEAHAAGGQAVEPRGLDPGVAGAAQGVGAMLVGQDEDEVGAGATAVGPAAQERQARQGQGAAAEQAQELASRGGRHRGASWSVSAAGPLRARRRPTKSKRLSGSMK